MISLINEYKIVDCKILQKQRKVRIIKPFEDICQLKNILQTKRQIIVINKKKKMNNDHFDSFRKILYHFITYAQQNTKSN